MKKTLLLCGLFASLSYGDTHIAASASLVNVKSAYDLCSIGDTLRIPSGNVTWDTCLEVTKRLIIFGNGSPNTILNANHVRKYGFFYFHGIYDTNLVRLSGISFHQIQTYTLSDDFSVYMRDMQCKRFRIDNCKFYDGYQNIEFYGVKGVVDTCTFTNFFRAILYTSGTNAQADSSWNDITSGTAEPLFVESNMFILDKNYPHPTWDHIFDTYNGGKIVARNNILNSDSVPAAVGQMIAFQTHGNAAGGVADTQGYWQQGYGARRGQSMVEIYNNNLHGKRIDFLCALRGSSNLIYNNTVVSVGSTPRIYFYEEEQWVTGNWNPLRTSWPAEDQVHNSFIWGNTFNGVSQSAGSITTGTYSSDYIQPDREYFLHEPQSSGGKAIFTGKNGATNTYPTDGVKYPTQGSMSFSSSGSNKHYPYTAYTFPHPLREIRKKKCVITIN